MDEEIKLDDFIEQWRIRMEFERVSNNGNTGYGRGAGHFQVYIRVGTGDNPIRVAFSTGDGRDPEIKDLVSCLSDGIRDYESYKNLDDDLAGWVNWADDMGAFFQGDRYSWVTNQQPSTKQVVMQSIAGWREMKVWHAWAMEVFGEEGFKEIQRLERL